MAHRPRPLIGLFAGVAAGLVASAAMAAFQSQAQKLLPEDGGDEDPATIKAADKASELVTGDSVPEPYRDASGQLVHYVTGAVLGGVYGVLTEYRREASTGFGSAYGIATSALLDEVGVPAAGLGPMPQDTPLATHAYGAASHLVYGWVLGGVRTLIAGRR
jgi:putative membrane protein